MKLCKFLILIACLAQKPCAGQSYFDNYYKTGYNNVLSCNVLAELDSGSVFVNYIRDSATHRQDFGMMKIDKNGNEVLKTSFNLFNQDHLAFTTGMKNFIPATSCSYFLAGTTYTNTDYYVVLDKINKASLDTMKIAIYTDPNFSHILNSFIKLNDNKYFLIGNKGNVSTSWPAIIQIDSNLVITASLSINNAPVNFSHYETTYNPFTKKMLMRGKIPNGQHPISFLHIDTLGLVTNTYSSVSSLTTIIGQTYFSMFDSTYVCVGAKKTSMYGNNALHKLCVTKYDMDLNMLWQKTYGDNALINALYDAVILPDGSIVASGAYSPLTSLPLVNEDASGVILKVNKDGNFRWMRKFDHHGPGNYWECLYGIDQSKEGGFIACGNVMNLPKAKAWAVKTDGEGCLLPGCASLPVSIDSVLIEPAPVDTTTGTGIADYDLKERVYVYPNPFGGSLNIELEAINGAAVKEYVVRLSNAMGQMIVTQRFRGNNLKLDLTNKGLGKGIYLVQVFDEGRLIASEKLVRE